MSETPTATADEAALRDMIQAQMDALCAKDIDGIMAVYGDEFHAFDAIPPFQYRDPASWRQVWEECLPHFPESFGIELRDLELTVGTDLAYAHWLSRFTGDEDHPATRNWLRFTAVYRKTDGRWRTVHEHISVPFDPETSQAILTLEV